MTIIAPAPTMSQPDRQTAERIALQALGWTSADARTQATLFECVVSAVMLGMQAERERVAGWLEDETHSVIARGTAADLATAVRRQR